MKKTLTVLFLLLTLLFSCTVPALKQKDESNKKKKDRQADGIVFKYSVTAVTSQQVTRADQTFTGTLTVTNLDTMTSEDFTWYAGIDEDTFTIVSAKTIILDPGTYDFDIVLTNANHQYAGYADNVTITDGENTIPLILNPVVGTIDSTMNLSQAASLRFRYPSVDLASLTDPKLGIIIDSSTETILDINPSTGIAEAYINTEAGEHNIQLKLYDSALQVGRSIDSQETQTIVLTGNVTMDITALHGETELDLSLTGGDSTFTFTFPQEVQEEAGGTSDLQVIFTLTGSVNGTHETSLVLTEEADGSVTASCTFTGLSHDTVDLSLTFKDITDDEIIGSSAFAGVELQEGSQSLVFDLELRRRAVVSGNIMACLGVNVFDESGSPVAGAGVYANGELKGITGSGAFGTAGYVKLYLPAGTYDITAESGALTGAAGVTLEALDVENVDVILETELVLNVLQEIPTNGARDYESFTIGTDNYLAIAEYRNGSDLTIDSSILKWNGSQFIEIQTISTSGGNEWEAFTINSDIYLAVANTSAGSSAFNINSVIYKWSGSSFVQFQLIPTNGAVDWESFTIGSDTFLAVANCDNSTTRDINSKIYKWNSNEFELYQEIPTNGGFDMEFFTIGSDIYLAVANLYSTQLSSYNVNSKIYKWDGSYFQEFQLIPSHGATDWEYFTIDSNVYLALANKMSDSSYYTDSKIYKWDGFEFIEIQSIPTTGARDWEMFRNGTNYYLAVANERDEEGGNIQSKIFKWNGTSFVEEVLVDTYMASDWEVITINDDLYLGIANHTNGSSHNIYSPIYQVTLE